MFRLLTPNQLTLYLQIVIIFGDLKYAPIMFELKEKYIHKKQFLIKTLGLFRYSI